MIGDSGAPINSHLDIMIR